MKPIRFSLFCVALIFLFSGTVYATGTNTDVLQQGIASDTLAPRITYGVACDGSVGYSTKGDINEDPHDNTSSKIKSLTLDTSLSSNYVLDNSDLFPGYTVFCTFKLKVKDVTKPAVAVVVCSDGAGNIARSTISYTPWRLHTVPDTVVFKRFKRAGADSVALRLYNDEDSVFVLSSISSGYNGYLSMRFSSDTMSLPYYIPPHGYIDLMVYNIDKEGKDFQDMLFVGDTCVTLAVTPMRLHYPRLLQVEELDYSAVRVGDTSIRAFHVYNVCALTINLDSMTKRYSTKTFQLDPSLSFPITLPAGSSTTFSVAFMPDSAAIFNGQIVIHAATESTDTVVNLSGIGFKGTQDVSDNSSVDASHSVRNLRLSTEHLQFEFISESLENAQWSLYDMMGRRVHSGLIGSNGTLSTTVHQDLAPIAAGTYVLCVYCGGQYIRELTTVRW